MQLLVNELCEYQNAWCNDKKKPELVYRQREAGFTRRQIFLQGSNKLGNETLTIGAMRCTGSRGRLQIPTQTDIIRNP